MKTGVLVLLKCSVAYKKQLKYFYEGDGRLEGTIMRKLEKYYILILLLLISSSETKNNFTYTIFLP